MALRITTQEIGSGCTQVEASTIPERRIVVSRDGWTKSRWMLFIYVIEGGKSVDRKQDTYGNFSTKSQALVEAGMLIQRWDIQKSSCLGLGLSA